MTKTKSVFKERADAAGMYQGYMMKDLQEDKITLNEFTLLMIISSRTLAWGKRFDFIPKEYFKMGKNGTKLTALRASLIKKGYIKFTPSKKVNSWSRYELMNIPFTFVPQREKKAQDKEFNEWMNTKDGSDIFMSHMDPSDRDNKAATASTRAYWEKNEKEDNDSK